MREFKFEAWCKPTDTEPGYMIRWVELKELHDLGHLSLMEMLDMPNVYDVRQYTGLKDKNGKDIYEGDVVIIPQWNRKYKVVFEDGMFKCDGSTSFSLVTTQGEISCEVIGNIYENPELLNSR